MNNRRAFHYSYNLINNLSSEEASKDNTKKLENNESCEQQPGLNRIENSATRKLSLPTNKNSTASSTIRKNSSHEYRGVYKDSPEFTTERKSGKIGYQNGLLHWKNGSMEGMTRRATGGRYSDPLYEQRSLPPLPFNKQRGGSEGTIYNSLESLAKHKRILQMSSKSQSVNASLSYAGNFGRKEGVSAIGNHGYMHGKERKKGVVDSTDDSHYQRQFLRVLNKRF